MFYKMFRFDDVIGYVYVCFSSSDYNHKRYSKENEEGARTAGQPEGDGVAGEVQRAQAAAVRLLLRGGGAQHQQPPGDGGLQVLLTNSASPTRS